MAKPDPPATWMHKSTQDSVGQDIKVPTGPFRLHPSTMTGIFMDRYRKEYYFGGSEVQSPLFLVWPLFCLVLKKSGDLLSVCTVKQCVCLWGSAGGLSFDLSRFY